MNDKDKDALIDQLLGSSEKTERIIVQLRNDAAELGAELLGKWYIASALKGEVIQVEAREVFDEDDVCEVDPDFIEEKECPYNQKFKDGTIKMVGSDCLHCDCCFAYWETYHVRYFLSDGDGFVCCTYTKNKDLKEGTN